VTTEDPVGTTARIFAAGYVLSTVVTGQLELALIALYPVPFSFAIGFFICKWHVKHLAYSGGEDRYPEMVTDVVRKYRRENEIEPDPGPG